MLQRLRNIVRRCSSKTLDYVVRRYANICAVKHYATLYVVTRYTTL